MESETSSQSCLSYATTVMGTFFVVDVRPPGSSLFAQKKANPENTFLDISAAPKWGMLPGGWERKSERLESGVGDGLCM